MLESRKKFHASETLTVAAGIVRIDAAQSRAIITLRTDMLFATMYLGRRLSSQRKLISL